MLNLPSEVVIWWNLKMYRSVVCSFGRDLTYSHLRQYILLHCNESKLTHIFFEKCKNLRGSTYEYILASTPNFGVDLSPIIYVHARRPPVCLDSRKNSYLAGEHIYWDFWKYDPPLSKIHVVVHLCLAVECEFCIYESSFQNFSRDDGGQKGGINNKKHLKNVGPIRHNEPPHANSRDVASGTVARRLRIDVHNNDDNDNAWQREPLWPHGMGPISHLVGRSKLS